MSDDENNDRDERDDDVDDLDERAPKRLRADLPSKFVDDIAEDEDDPDAEDEDEDDGDADDDEINDIIADDADDADNDGADAAPAAPANKPLSRGRVAAAGAVPEDDSLHQALDQAREAREADAIMKRLQQKYGDGDDDDDDDLNDESAEYDNAAQMEETPAAMLPSIKDPKLWLIRCDPGKEEESVLALLKRYFFQQHSPDSALYIHSAFTTPASKGYIYVEAEKEVHVKMAIRGLRAVKWWSVQLVPITQMVNAVKFNNQTASVQVKQWVRIKGGLYKGDLAQVMLAEDQNTQVTVRIIPRVDLDVECAESAARHEGTRVRKRAAGKGMNRPMPQLLSIGEIHQHNGYTERKTDRDLNTVVTIFNNNRYKHGYLYKKVNIYRLILENVIPTTDELETFRARNRDADQQDDDDIDDDMEYNTILPVNQVNYGTHNSVFVMGDRIVVSAGPFKNITGRIVSVAKTQCTVLPDAGQPIAMRIDLDVKEMRKLFRLGDHVKVVAGMYKDETGMITHVNNGEETLLVFSDVSQRELKVKVDEVIESSEVSAGRESLGHFELYDLVQLTNDTVGVIVKVEIASFKLLTNRGVVQTVRLAEISGKRSSRFATALDSLGNQLQRDDVVNVHSGTHAGKQGTIKHIYRRHLFLFSRTQLDLSGVFAAPTNQVSLVGQTSFTRTINGASHSPPRLYDGSKSPHPTRDDKGALGAPQAKFVKTRIHDRHPLLGKAVVITGGPYKSFMGIVTDINEINATVELHAFARKVNIAVGLLAERTGHTATSTSSERDYLGSQTPLLGSRTPAWGDMGSATPAHDNAMTPAHPSTQDSSAWSAQTPYREDANDDDDDETTAEWARDHSLSAMTPTPLTPNVRTPHDNDYTPPRTPSNLPLTPQQRHDAPLTPTTPAADEYRTPQTPSDQSARGVADAFVYPVGARVHVNVDNGERTATIVAVNADRTLRVTLDDKTSRVLSRASITRPVVPSAPNSIVVISGSSAGSVGELVGGHAGEAIVKIKGEIEIFPLSLLCALDKSIAR